MFVRTDPSRVLVLDDFLPNYSDDPKLLGNLAVVEDNYRPDGIIGNDTNVRDLPFAQTVIDQLPRACSLLGLPTVKSVNSIVFLRSQWGSAFSANIHTDDTSGYEWGYTFSYHWRGHAGSGGTVFYDDKQGTEELHRVEFKPNRLVAFPARYPHTGWAEPDQPGHSQRDILAVFVVLAG